MDIQTLAIYILAEAVKEFQEERNGPELALCA